MCIQKGKVRFSDDSCWYNDEKLICHYTNSDGLFGILRSMKLKVSSFANLNDANEINIINYCCDDSISRVFTCKYIEKHCGIISFTKSFKYSGRSFCGALKPSMWAYYGDKMKGACLVINQERFLAKNKEYFNRHFYKFEDVEYDIINARGKIHIENEHKNTIINNYRELFFIKHFDWQQENEKRLFVIDDLEKDVFLDLEGCIAFIVLGHNFIGDKVSVQNLLTLLSDKTAVCYSVIDKDSFAFISPSEMGYYLNPASFRLSNMKNQETAGTGSGVSFNT